MWLSVYGRKYSGGLSTAPLARSELAETIRESQLLELINPVYGHLLGLDGLEFTTDC